MRPLCPLDDSELTHRPIWFPSAVDILVFGKLPIGQYTFPVHASYLAYLTDGRQDQDITRTDVSVYVATDIMCLSVSYNRYAC